MLLETRWFTLELDPNLWTLDTDNHAFSIRKMYDNNDIEWQGSKVILGHLEFIKQTRVDGVRLVG